MNENSSRGMTRAPSTASDDRPSVALTAALQLVSEIDAWRGAGNLAAVARDEIIARAYVSLTQRLQHPVFAFLLGSGPLNGLWYGDVPEPERGKRKQPYWWRIHLRNALTDGATIGSAPPSDAVGSNAPSSPPLSAGEKI